MSTRNFGARNVSLDGIRGIAISLVILHHAFQEIQGADIMSRAISILMESLWVGVDLFFVLSGYLITGILLRSRDGADYFRIFYMRRSLRIFPLYYVFLAAMFLIGLFKADLMPKMDFSWNLLYLANVRTAIYGWGWRPLGHLWSLSVEEQFYLVWPAIIYLLPRRRTVTSICAVFCIFVLFRQTYGYAASPNYIFTYSVLHLDGLLLGAVLAALHQSYPASDSSRKAAWAALLASCAALALVVLHDHGLKWYFWERGLSLLNYSVVAACGAAFIAVSIYSDAKSQLNRTLAFRPLVEMGKYSYGIYLLHYPLDSLFRTLHLHPAGVLATMPYALFLAVASFLAALGTWTLIEERFINLKDRLFAYKPDTAARA